ncbi:C-GCAxxG-C-C family protein [Thermodesulfobacteriota bacterium]
MSEKVAKRSRELFEGGYYCAESVLLAIAESRGIKSELIPKIATGFCSGISRTCGMCGAVIGAIMVINLVTGRNSPDESVEENYALCQKMMASFQDRFGSTNCQELTGCDLGTDEGQKIFGEKNHIEKCKDYTEEAARIAHSIMEG